MHHFLALFSKVFRPRSARFVIFALGTPLFRVFSKVHEFVQNTSFLHEFSTFCHFALSALPLSDFQQRALVCRKQPFEPKFSTFCHFCTRCTTFQRFSAKFSGRDQHFLSFLHWAHHVLEFSVKCTVCTKQRFQPDISTFSHFCTGDTIS